MNIDEFDYELPESYIAQHPTAKRDACKLMVLDRDKKSIEHRVFADILEYLNPGDCLVLNDSKVIPARIFGVKEGTGANVEFLLIKCIENDKWETMVRPGRKVKIGDTILFGENSEEYVNAVDTKAGTVDETCKFRPLLRAKVLAYGDDGTRIVEFDYDGIFMEILEKLGTMPLPPYIHRDDSLAEDKEMYQTVYARYDGSVAAPTAGLHFTEELLAQVKAKGVNIVYVTLHVGIGTFRPVKVDKIEEHHMHLEEYTVSEKTASIINKTIKSGGRVISVGTTSTRTLESSAYMDENTGKYLVQGGSANTDIFIYPPYKFKIVDALITNFHLPKSTLLMLISALYDRTEILKAYEEAKKQDYRFFSYGDAMIIK